MSLMSHDHGPVDRKGPIGWMAAHPVAANLLMGVLVIGGILFAFGTKREVFPEIDMDMVNMEADLTEVWELPVHCSFQGGAKHTSTGNAIATCAPIRHAYEFEPGNPDFVWDGLLACGNGLNTYTPRFMVFDPWAY